MSDDPYEAPKVNLEITGEAIKPGQFEIGQALSEGWKTTWATFPQWLGFGLLAMLCITLSAITIIGYFVVVPVLAWGCIRYLLNAFEGTAKVEDLFCGFKEYGKVLGRMLLFGVVTFLLAMVGQSVSIAGGIVGSEALANIGMVLYLVFLAFFFRIYFAPFLMVHRDLGAIDAISSAWTMTKGNSIKIILMVIIAYLVMLGGLLAIVLGVIPAMMMTYYMWTSVYLQLVSDPELSTQEVEA